MSFSISQISKTVIYPINEYNPKIGQEGRGKKVKFTLAIEGGKKNKHKIPKQTQFDGNYAGR